MAKAGPLPFRQAYPEFAKRSRKDREQNWNVFQGWKEQPKKPETRKITSSLGNVYDMPGEDLDKFVQYMKHSSEHSQEYTEAEKKLLKNVQTPADYVDFVFDDVRLKKLKKKQVVDMEAKEGHIKHLWYNAVYTLLKVQFWNDTICCFFNVPGNVAQLLMHYAENNTLAAPGKGGKVRHALGVEFWNLIRVRGTQHLTRYPFEYVTDNNAGPRQQKYEYTTAWNSRLQRDVQVRIENSKQNQEADRRLLEDIAQEESAIESAERIYDYENEDLVTFFENGAYDDMIGKCNAHQRNLLIQAEAAYNADKDIADIENLLRQTGLPFPTTSELHAKYD